jgi:hypothetical protein
MTPTRRWPSEWVAPVALFVLAAAVRLAVASQSPFPTTEGSAYYAGVAANLVQGDGLTSDAVWSYATPPLVAPKPAFELWMPMSSLLSAVAMALLGPGFWAAQAGSAMLGALVAPLSWAVARRAAGTQGLDRRRGRAVALAAGLLACFAGPLVISAAMPDSYTPFTVFAVLAALLVPRALGIDDGRPVDGPPRASRAAGLASGMALGLAYLSRQEAIWLGLVVLIVAAWSARRRATFGGRMRVIGASLWPIVLGGLLVVTPWLLRNMDAFGSPFPGQALENMILRSNEDIFAFRDRPTLAGYLGQGMATVLANPLRAAFEVLADVILLAAFPIGAAGLAALVGLRHAPALRRVTPLSMLLASGGLTFLSTCLLFPVATRWGTFLHASGPLLVGLIVAAALGGDALLWRISRARHWHEPNVVLAPVALLTVTVLLCLLQVSFTVSQSRQLRSRYEAITAAIGRVAGDMDGAGDLGDAGDPGRPLPAVIITDHPMYLAHASGRATLALPSEEPAAVLDLAARFGTPWLVVIDGRRPYPGALLSEPGVGCLAMPPVPLEGTPEGAWLFRLAEACAPRTGLEHTSGGEAGQTGWPQDRSALLHGSTDLLHGRRPSDASASPYTREQPIGREARSEAHEIAARCSGSCRTPGRNVA